MRRWLALPAAIVVLALIGCGSDEESSTDTRSTDAAAAGAGQGGGAGARPDDGGDEGRSSQPGDGGSRGGGSGGEGGGSGGEVDLSVDPGSIRGARVTGTGAVQTLPPSPQAQETAQENSYASIRGFGSEAEGAEATTITFALVQYLDAKARGDWATACARLYSVVREGVEKSAEGANCPEAFGTLMSRVPAASRAEQARIDVSSVRRGEGDRAFVIYKTPDTLSADMPMYVEGGVWKVGALEAYALRPGQAG